MGDRVPIGTHPGLALGGLAAALNELAGAAGAGLMIEESAVPVRPSVAGACEALGLEVLTVAKEGKLIAVVPADEASSALEAVRANKLGEGAAIIGEVRPAQEGTAPVILKTTVGGERVLDMPYGEDLPRIC